MDQYIFFIVVAGCIALGNLLGYLIYIQRSSKRAKKNGIKWTKSDHPYTPRHAHRNDIGSNIARMKRGKVYRRK